MEDEKQFCHAVKHKTMDKEGKPYATISFGIMEEMKPGEYVKIKSKKERIIPWHNILNIDKTDREFEKGE